MTYCVLVFTTVLFVLTGREVSNRPESHFCVHGRKMSLLVQPWNQRNATEKVPVFFPQKWKNEFLTWNPAGFCGMELLPVSLSLLWVPDVVIREECVVLIISKNTKLFCLRKKKQRSLSAVMELKSGFQRTFSP